MATARRIQIRSNARSRRDDSRGRCWTPCRRSDSDGDRSTYGLLDRLRLPGRRRARGRTGGGGGSRRAAARLQGDREALYLAEVRIDVDVVLRIGGRAGEELRRPLVEQVAAGVDGEVWVRGGSAVALDLRCGRGY